MHLVIDASVAVKWIVNEPLSDAASKLLDQGYSLIAPDLMYLEAANALWAMSRRGDISHADLAQAVDTLLLAPVEIPSASRDLLPAAARLAADLAHPIYDCCYLALGMRERARVVTADERFLAAVRKQHHLAQEIVFLGDVLTLEKPES